MSEQIQDFIVWVGGAAYSRESFTKEAKQMGVCRRIPFVPEGITRGETRVFMVSDMSEEDRKRHKAELKRRDAIRYQQAKEQIARGVPREEATSHVVGPMPRGTPLIFAWFTVRNITYVTAPGTDLSKRLQTLNVTKHRYSEESFGFNDERECGSLEIGGIYLLSEENMEKCRDFASSSILQGRIELLSPAFLYTGKRFRGIKTFSSKLGDKLVNR